MNLGEEKSDKELREYLDEQCNSINKTLNQTRDFYSKQRHIDYQQFLNFNIKLGEFSFIIGAAIGPIIIVSDREIEQPIFVFLAMIIYLANGIFAIWRSKDIVEKQLDSFSSGNLYKSESEIY